MVCYLSVLFCNSQHDTKKNRTVSATEEKIATPPATRNMLTKESLDRRLLTRSKEKTTKTNVKLQIKLALIGSQPLCPLFH